MVEKALYDRNVRIMQTEDNCGKVSDGDHTFDELYRHRCILFAALINANPDVSWKSKLHSDGTMFDNYFIVGINTFGGQATYHYSMEYWELFKCKELERAPLWDGHTPEDAINRIMNQFT